MDDKLFGGMCAVTTAIVVLIAYFRDWSGVTTALATLVGCGIAALITLAWSARGRSRTRTHS